MSFAADGQQFLTAWDTETKRIDFLELIVTEFDGRSIKNIDDFIKVCADIKDGPKYLCDRPGFYAV